MVFPRQNLNNSQKFLSHGKKLQILLKPRARLFVWAIIFQQSDFKLPDLVKSVWKWTVLTLSHAFLWL